MSDEVAAGRLTRSERRATLQAAAVPVVLVAVISAAGVALGHGTVGDAVINTVIFGGLLGLVAWVIAHERGAAAHCPRCDATGDRDRVACDECGYDLTARPRFDCEQRHGVRFEEGLCACGRRLQQLHAPRLGRQLRRTVWAGVWIGAWLVGTVLIIRYVL